jgi:hypothetical protein
MKFIKYSFALLSIVFFSSCLKSENDLAGLREDPGGIVTSITETQYQNTDANVLGNGFQIFANFSFGAPANEAVRFLTLHISQPRTVKMSGPMKVKISMTAHPGTYTFPPAGAITISEIEVPASTAASFDFPVKFTVNKSLLDVNEWYGATFTITSVSQGVFSELDKSIDVVFNEDPFLNMSKYSCQYKWSSTVQDAANQVAIYNNTKPVFLYESSPNHLEILDMFSGSAFLYANNTTTGANTTVFKPRFNLDATGKITSITNLGSGAAGTVANITLDATSPNQIVYTSNDERSMNVKYTFDLTSTINSVVTTRKVTVTEKYVYDQIQAMY